MPAMAAVKLRRSAVSAEFWREESSWKNAFLLNIVMHVRAATMLLAGLGGLILSASAETTGAGGEAEPHCVTLRRWMLVGSCCIGAGGVLAPYTWWKLRGTKLERGTLSARRLREKGFGNSRLGRSAHNTARQRGTVEKLAGCVGFPVLVCFIGVQIVGFSSTTDACADSLRTALTLYVGCLYGLVAFQCVCIQAVQCRHWRALDRTMLDDDEADEEAARVERPASAGTTARDPAA